MNGESIGQAKAGLKQCLKMLREQDWFTVVRFASEYSSFTPDLRQANTLRIAFAKGYIDGLNAYGGTEMQKALEYVLDIPSKKKGAMKIIVFMTDGDVGNENSLFRLLSLKLGRARLFTFGIGSAPNEYLMRKMAEIGRGQSRFIKSHEDIGGVMSDFFKTLDTPVLTDIKLKWLSANGNEESDVVSYPKPYPDIFYERPLTVFTCFPAQSITAMTISGKINGEDIRYEYKINDVGRYYYPAIEKIFWRSKINELMVKYILSNSDAEKEDFRKEIIQIALNHKLVTKFTSRVAVEEKVEKRSDGSLVTVRVPVPLPKGRNSSAFFSTATNYPLLLLCGAIAILAAVTIRRIRFCCKQNTGD